GFGRVDSGGDVTGCVGGEPLLAGLGGSEDVVDAALDDDELVGERGGGIGDFARFAGRAFAACAGGFAADHVPGRAGQPRKEGGHLSDAIEDTLGADEIEHAALLKSPL